jgi:CRISPR-associated protein Csm1
MLDYTTENMLLVKGDLSGIQDFIFNIPSEKAAKTLKGKSFYVQILSWLAEADLYQSLKGSQLIYNGGGNFYMLVPSKHKELLEKKQSQYIQELSKDGLFLTITHCSYNVKETYAKNLELLNKKAQINNQNRFINHSDFAFFEQTTTRDAIGSKKESFDFIKLAEWLVKSSDYAVESKSKNRGIGKFDLFFNFVNGGNRLSLNANAALPKYLKSDEDKFNQESTSDEEKVKEGNIMMFNHIAEYAKERTGTDNLGILAIDIDSLGAIIRESLPEISDNVKFSKELGTFFEIKLREILKTEIFITQRRSGKDKNTSKKFDYVSEKTSFGTAIYPVFVGGDDCFLVGAWDAIFNFTLVLKDAFDSYVKENETLKKHKLTFSAGLVLVSSTFPVNQFATLAKDALSQAKSTSGKNSISVFGYVFSWHEWKEIAELKEKLYTEIIEFDASKGLLNRLKASRKVFEQVQQKMLRSGSIELSVISDFFYGLRDYSPKKVESEIDKHKKQQVEYFVKIYLGYLTKAFIDKKPFNALIIPIAARWTEFLTRNINSNGKN